MQWINQLKIAVIEKDKNKIEKLMDTFPTLSTQQEMDAVVHLMQEAHKFLNSERESLASKLLKIKKQKEYLRSDITNRSSFDKSL